MGGAFIITLRDGLEAGLIVSIVLAYLKASGHRPHFRTVLLATVAAVALSLGVGAGIFVAAGEFEGRAEAAFAGFVTLTAVAFTSWMIVWMKRQAASIRRSLEREVATAIGMGSVLALALIPFSAVLREGLEASVFLFAATRTSTPLESTVGAAAGIVLAIGLAWGIYSGAYRLNLRLFFNVTGILLIFLAAGLLAHGMSELQEASLLPTFAHVWDMNHIIDDESGVGLWLKAVLGYNGNPSLLEVIAYPIYLAVAFWYFLALRPPRLAVATPTPTPSLHEAEQPSFD